MAILMWSFWFLSLVMTPVKVISLPAFLIALALSAILDARSDEMYRHFRTEATSKAFYTFVGISSALATASSTASSLGPTSALLTAQFSLLLKELLAMDKLFDRERVLTMVGYGLAGFWTLFVVFSHGLSVEGLIELFIPLYIALSTFVSISRRAGGWMFFAGAAALAVLMFPKMGNLTSGKLAAVYLLIFPMVYLGFEAFRKEV